MVAKEKKQCQLRFYSDEFEKIQEKCKEEDISYQRVGEILFGAFLKNNKEVMKLVRKYVEDHRDRKKNPTLDELERNDLYRLLESQSPLTH